LVSSESKNKNRSYLPFSIIFTFKAQPDKMLDGKQLDNVCFLVVAPIVFSCKRELDWIRQERDKSSVEHLLEPFEN